MSKLLIDEPPLQLLPSLAVKYGLNEAIVIQQLHYWLRDKHNGSEKDGLRWIFNSYKEWHEQFPFLSPRAIQRAFLSLEEAGVIKARQEGINRRKYYTIDYDRLDNGPSCQNGTMTEPEWHDEPSKLAHSSIAETTTKTTTIARKRAPQNDELLIAKIPHGPELQAELSRAYESKNRRPPTHFVNIQQRDAYVSCATGLNGKFMPAVSNALSRGRESRGDLLSTLQAWQRNERTSNANHRPAHATVQDDDPEGLARARRLSGG